MYRGLRPIGNKRAKRYLQKWPSPYYEVQGEPGLPGCKGSPEISSSLPLGQRLVKLAIRPPPAYGTRGGRLWAYGLRENSTGNPLMPVAARLTVAPAYFFPKVGSMQEGMSWKAGGSDPRASRLGLVLAALTSTSASARPCSENRPPV